MSAVELHSGSAVGPVPKSIFPSLSLSTPSLQAMHASPTQGSFLKSTPHAAHLVRTGWDGPSTFRMIEIHRRSTKSNTSSPSTWKKSKNSHGSAPPTPPQLLALGSGAGPSSGIVASTRATSPPSTPGGATKSPSHAFPNPSASSSTWPPVVVRQGGSPAAPTFGLCIHLQLSQASPTWSAAETGVAPG